MKKFACKRIVYDFSKQEYRIIEKYELMNEKEFIEFAKEFIVKDTCKDYGVFHNEEEILSNIEYIKKTGIEEWSLGNNSINDIGFEEMFIDLVEVLENE